MKEGLAGEVSGIRQIFIYILILGIVSALFAEFSDLFAGQQIAQAGFYFLYLFLMVILTKVFLFVSQTAAAAMEDIVLFIKLFIPTYFVAVGTAQGPKYHGCAVLPSMAVFPQSMKHSFPHLKISKPGMRALPCIIIHIRHNLCFKANGSVLKCTKFIIKIFINISRINNLHT